MPDFIDEVYEKWNKANCDWLTQHGPKANGDDIRASVPRLFRAVVGPHLQMLADIELLREGEGNAVAIVCDNADFNGLPNSAVDCCGDWTNWEDRRFGGDNLASALRAAAIAKTTNE